MPRTRKRPADEGNGRQGGKLRTQAVGLLPIAPAARFETYDNLALSGCELLLGAGEGARALEQLRQHVLANANLQSKVVDGRQIEGVEGVAATGSAGLYGGSANIQVPSRDGERAIVHCQCIPHVPGIAHAHLPETNGHGGAVADRH